MPNAFIIGGSGQIGFAIANRLASDGWDVILSSRQPPTFGGLWQHVELDIRKPADLSTALTGEFDLLVSCVAFDATDARKLLEVQSRIKRIVVISSASVYTDSAGRTLDEAKDCGFPVFDGAITEQTSTVLPGPETYSTKKIAMELELLDKAKVPVTVLRPCAIHGRYSKHCREWWFVKRILDGRQQIPLAYDGRSRFQTTSTSAIADVVARLNDKTLPAIINVADADSPSVREIGHAIIDVMDSNTELVGLADEPYPPSMGASPWSIPHPFVCESVARSKIPYAETVPVTVRWLMEAVHGHAWQEMLPQLASYPRNLFDYKNEDDALCQDAAGVT